MPSQSVLNVVAKGLVTAPNPLLIPKDALVVADNIVLDRPGFIQSRRGFKKYTNAVGGDVWAVAPFQGRILANYGTATAAVNLRVNSSNDGTGSWSAVSGTYTNTVTDGFRMHTAEVLDHLYLTCAQGIHRLSTANTAEPAGMPKAIGIDLSGPAAVLTGSGGFLADGQCVAYRAVFGRSIGGALRLGSPSSRTVVANAAQTSGYSAATARNTVIRVLLPKANNTASTALTTDYFLQLYRSGQVANGQTPSDEMQLVFEAYLTAGNISAGYVDVTDKQPDSLRGAYLYTNPNTGEEGVRPGILNANEPQPPAADIAWWRDVMWYAANENFGRTRILFQILGTGSGGLTVGDTFTIGGASTRTYTAIAPGTPSAGQFVVESNYAASVNIERTATNLVAAINKDSGNTGFYAYYISGAAPDAPGKVLLESRLDTGAGLSAGLTYTGSSPNAFAPSLSAPASPSAYLESNQLWFSKPGQPEAVPSVNFLEVGPAGSAILRVLPLGNQLYVLSTSGVYRVLGDNFTNFTVDPVDLTAICAAPESAVTLDGSLFFLTNQGAVEVTEGTLAYISGPIDSDLRELLQSVLYDQRNGSSPLKLYAFSVAHQLDHRVMFWLPIGIDSTDCGFAYVWDTRARAWSRWYRGDTIASYAFSCGCYSQSGPTAVGLTMAEQNGASANDCFCYVERRELTTNDFQDSIAGSATTIAINRSVKWAYQDANDASTGKHWREVQFLFGDSRPTNITVVLDTEIQDVNNTEETSTTSTTYTTPVNNKMHRLPVGQNCGRAARLGARLTCNAKQQGFDVAGFALHFRAFGPRLTRGP